MTGNPLFPGKNDMDMMRLILQMFNGSEELPSALKQTFQQNNIFSSARLPEPTESEYDFDLSLESRLEHANNSAVSFARECLRLDPTKRPSAQELLSHDFFQNFSEQFDDEIQTLIEYDKQERNNTPNKALSKLSSLTNIGLANGANPFFGNDVGTPNMFGRKDMSTPPRSK